MDSTKGAKQIAGSALVAFALFLQVSYAPGAIQVLPLETLAPEMRPDQATAKIADTLRSALEQFQAGKIDACFELLQSAQKAEPNLPPARLMLGRLLIAANRVGEGRAQLEQAAADEPNHPDVYIAFGNLALAEGRLTDAALQFEKAAVIDVPKSWSEQQKRRIQGEAQAGLAAVAERRGRWELAEEHIRNWLEADPKSYAAHERLALTLVARDRIEEAYRVLQRAARLTESPLPAELAVASMLTQSGKADQARPWVERAGATAIGNAAAQQAIAAWYLQQDQPEKAKQHAAVAARLDPQARDLAILQGSIARRLHQSEEAEACFQKHYTAFPADFRASNGLALVLVEQTDPDKRSRAVQLAEINARQYPRMAEALATLGWVYFNTGRLAEAEQALQAATSSGQASSDTAYYLARVLAGRVRQEQVIKMLQSALDAPGEFVFRQEARRWLDELKTTGLSEKRP